MYKKLAIFTIVLASIGLGSFFAIKKFRKKKKRTKAKKPDAEQLHHTTKEMYEHSLSKTRFAEFQHDYEMLERGLASVPPPNKDREVEINDIGNRLTFLMTVRNSLSENPMNPHILAEAARQFPDDVKRAASHLPELGQKMCVATAQSIANRFIEGLTAKTA